MASLTLSGPDLPAWAPEGREVKRPEGPPARSRGPAGPKTSSYCIFLSGWFTTFVKCTFSLNMILKFAHYAHLILDDISGCPYKLWTMLTLYKPLIQESWNFYRNIFKHTKKLRLDKMNMLKVSLHCALGDFFIQLFLIWVICVAFATVLAF